MIIEFISKKTKLLPSFIYVKLKDVPNEVLCLAMMEGKSDILKERVVSFLKNYKKERLYISGKDLKKLGIKPGPIYSQILNGLLYAQLDGEVNSKKDEIKFVKNFLKERNKQ